MKTFTELAIHGFINGDDNFGEMIVGVSPELHWDASQNGYYKIVKLREGKNYDHQSTSCIGFYLNSDETEVMVYSCKEVIIVPITEEMKQEIKHAIHSII